MCSGTVCKCISKHTHTKEINLKFFKVMLSLKMKKKKKKKSAFVSFVTQMRECTAVHRMPKQQR